jgi:transporter family protein
MSWLAWALIAAVFWGVGPIFAKLGLEKPDALTALLIRSVAVVAVLVVWALFRGDFRGSIAQVNGRTLVLLLLEGASASVLAHFAYFKALKEGSIAGVVPIAAAYPLISRGPFCDTVRKQTIRGKRHRSHRYCPGDIPLATILGDRCLPRDKRRVSNGFLCCPHPA